MSVQSATVVIATKNRRRDLAKALESVARQTAQTEIIVIDDGSSDGTADFVTTQFPQAKLVCQAESVGYIASRNLGARLAQGEVIFSIDDDACFTHDTTIETCLQYFEQDRIGAVALPFINVNTDSRTHQLAPENSEVWITDKFIGTAHAVRRTLFLELGGYRESLVHQGEEIDFCIRMLDAGYYVALASCSPIHHFESPRRSWARMDFYGPRNALLFVYMNIPGWYLPWRLLTQFALLVKWTVKPKRLVTRLSGIAAAFPCMMRLERRPVSRATYRLFRRIGRTRHERLDLIAGLQSSTGLQS